MCLSVAESLCRYFHCLCLNLSGSIYLLLCRSMCLAVCIDHNYRFWPVSACVSISLYLCLAIEVLSACLFLFLCLCRTLSFAMSFSRCVCLSVYVFPTGVFILKRRWWESEDVSAANCIDGKTKLLLLLLLPPHLSIGRIHRRRSTSGQRIIIRVRVLQQAGKEGWMEGGTLGGTRSEGQMV